MVEVMSACGSLPKPNRSVRLACPRLQARQNREGGVHDGALRLVIPTNEDGGNHPSWLPLIQGATRQATRMVV